MRSSKSDTSLTDSFVVIDNNTTSDMKERQNPLNILREGFRWQRQLLFKAKLTMHTAFDRKDNTQPASITALAVSKLVFQINYNMHYLSCYFTCIYFQRAKNGLCR